jgi:hypothetical protein
MVGCPVTFVDGCLNKQDDCKKSLNTARNGYVHAEIGRASWTRVRAVTAGAANRFTSHADRGFWMVVAEMSDPSRIVGNPP